MRRFAFAVLVLVALGSQAAEESQPNWGSFIGSVMATWLPDGRTMRLESSFAYKAPAGEIWEAPKGSIVDGASIPRWAWALVGGPFEGKYREASVIHDVACDERRRPWQAVHRAFYTAMRANGVAVAKAKVMYAAVYHFGPRWPRIEEALLRTGQTAKASNMLASHALKGETLGTLEQTAPASSRQPELVGYTAEFKPEAQKLSRAEFDQLTKLIEEDDLSLEEIEDYRGLEQAP